MIRTYYLLNCKLSIITGCIYLHRCLGIFIKIEGNGYARWETGAGEHRSVHTCDEKYFSEKWYCVGSNAGNYRIAQT